jgi:hypothetical protein
LTSFDAKRIRINKKVKDFYEALTTYQDANMNSQEVYVPLVIAEPIQEAIPVPTGSDNPFLQYSYVETTGELTEENYENTDVKIIKIF